MGEKFSLFSLCNLIIKALNKEESNLIEVQNSGYMLLEGQIIA